MCRSMLAAGETLGLVGESGSGKTTLARSLLGLTAADPESRISMNGRVLPPRIGGRAPGDVKALQIVFQNPDSALNRSHTVRRTDRPSRQPSSRALAAARCSGASSL